MSAPPISAPSGAVLAPAGAAEGAHGVPALPVHVNPPVDAADVWRWRDEWLEANAHLPRADRYPALSGAMMGHLIFAMTRLDARERTVEELLTRRRP